MSIHEIIFNASIFGFLGTTFNENVELIANLGTIVSFVISAVFTVIYNVKKASGTATSGTKHAAGAFAVIFIVLLIFAFIPKGPSEPSYPPIIVDGWEEEISFDAGDVVEYDAGDFLLTILNTGNGAAVTGYTSASGENLVIPSEVYDVKVTQIQEEAFLRCYEVEHISMPNSISFIGSRAFSNCTNLKSVDLSAGLDTIEYETFSGCSSLSDVNIPEGVKHIGELSFASCGDLEVIDLPLSVETIGFHAFLKSPTEVRAYYRKEYYSDDYRKGYYGGRSWVIK